MLSVAFALAVGSAAQAASVIWTIDSTASTLGGSGTGQAPLSGLTLPLRLVGQGTNPLPTATPTIPMKISGTLVTDTDFTSSIKFLKTGTITGETVGNFEPLSDGSAGKAPADWQNTIQAKFGATFVSTTDSAWRNMQHDFSAPAAIAITGGSFPTTTATLTLVTGDLDYRGYGPGAGIGSGSTELARLLAGDANFDRTVDGGDYTIWADNFDPGGSGNQFYQGDFSGDGVVDGGDYTLWADNYLQTEDPFVSPLNAAGDAKITKSGGTYTMTIPLSVAIFLPVDDGDTSTTTDDIFIDLRFVGTLIATAPAPADASAIPEPSTLALAGIGAVALLAFAARRRSAL